MIDCSHPTGLRGLVEEIDYLIIHSAHPREHGHCGMVSECTLCMPRCPLFLKKDTLLVTRPFKTTLSDVSYPVGWIVFFLHAAAVNQRPVPAVSLIYCT